MVAARRKHILRIKLCRQPTRIEGIVCSLCRYAGSDLRLVHARIDSEKGGLTRKKGLKLSSLALRNCCARVLQSTAKQNVL
jgi:hypothetical protein